MLPLLKNHAARMAVGLRTLRTDLDTEYDKPQRVICGSPTRSCSKLSLTAKQAPHAQLRLETKKPSDDRRNRGKSRRDGVVFASKPSRVQSKHTMKRDRMSRSANDCNLSETRHLLLTYSKQRRPRKNDQSSKCWHSRAL